MKTLIRLCAAAPVSLLALTSSAAVSPASAPAAPIADGNPSRPEYELCATGLRNCLTLDPRPFTYCSSDARPPCDDATAFEKARKARKFQASPKMSL